MDDPSSSHKPGWLERLSAMLLREPEDRKELVTLLHSAFERNLLDAEALSMIEGVLAVSELAVRDVMIPRSQMDVVQVDDSVETFLPFVLECAHSRFPVIGDSKDEVIGILLAKELLQYFADPAGFDLRDSLRPAVFIPESKRLNVLLREFRQTRNHMAIVVDEYGGVAGVVTIEDVIEQIVGDIEDEFDIHEDEGDIFGLPDHSYRVSGETPVERVAEAFEVTLRSSDPDEVFDTIGGLIAHELGRVPRKGEVLLLGGLRFVVLHTKGGLVRWFKVTPAAADESATNS